MSNDTPGVPSAHDALIEVTLDFCRFLRASGFPVAADAAPTALAALCAIGATDSARLRAGLGTVFVNRPHDLSTFAHLFDAFWLTRADATPSRPLSNPAPAAVPAAAISGFDTQASAATALASAPGGAALRTAADTLEAREHASLARLARALEAKLARRRSRRRERGPNGRTLDYRATLRRSLRYGGLPLALIRQQPRVTRAELVLLCDVSRSMQAHVRLFLALAAAVLQRAWRVEVFLFGDRLARVTERWREGARSELDELLVECGGGTRIGECLEEFVGEYPFCLRSGRGTCVILSDGLDSGESVLLARALRDIRHRTRELIWLNPLQGVSRYAERSRGMRAARPYIDLFAPAHDLASLWRLVAHLSSSVQRRVQRRPLVEKSAAASTPESVANLSLTLAIPSLHKTHRTGH